MKKILIFIGIMMILSSCSVGQKKSLYNDGENFENYTVVVIDSCEYIQWRASYGYLMITHKGNCKNPIHYKR